MCMILFWGRCAVSLCRFLCRAQSQHSSVNGTEKLKSNVMVNLICVLETKSYKMVLDCVKHCYLCNPLNYVFFVLSVCDIETQN